MLIYYTRSYICCKTWACHKRVVLPPSDSWPESVSCGFFMFSPCVDFLWVLQFPSTFQQHVRAQWHGTHSAALQIWSSQLWFWDAHTETSTIRDFIFKKFLSTCNCSGLLSATKWCGIVAYLVNSFSKQYQVRVLQIRPLPGSNITFNVRQYCKITGQDWL